MSLAQDKLRPNPFAGDTGDIDPRLAEALDHDDFAPRLEAIIAVIADVRVLVPVLAHEHPGRTESGGVVAHGGMEKDPCTAAAMLAVEAPDGRAAMPIFSSVAALHAWNPSARPVPVHTQNAAIAALAEADGLLVLDPGSDRPMLLGRPAVNALATGETWRPPWKDDELPTILARALAGIDGLKGLQITPGRKAETAIVLAVDGSAPREQVSAALAEASRRLAHIDELQHRLDSIELVPARTA
ncbi:SseB family protein [Flaviflexus equikiangi]|uniref:SseB family protein n=1 Tax=Flaviflexus equikiangi TaxID=2758573 RepID=A0ABS2TEJ1_9ACTO|nr:SseB family protein [Flaviflexus equikiangi]MBM9432742.1 SseB family protein [Flaviflexus equikiangi]